MGNVTVNISFQDALLKEIDAEAKKESRSRSELLREAARNYVQKQKKWERLFALGDGLSRRNKLKPEDVNGAIRSVRKQKRDRS
ncbi:MAG TPA: CopG family transcriptional regulator [Verrucomicrobia bacterium]|nr:MAG: CopG family transcriptional regulator [Lentisphaerae bacterium GWF2_57_35]HBA82896.1 CopG family transcriptional regulator [Verrucomicrobiota bacterium]